MYLAQISDTHLLGSGPAAEGRIAALRKAVAYIAALDPAPIAVIHSGDIAHNGTAEEYALAAELLAPLKMPLYVVPGNRDQRAALCAAFPKAAPSSEGAPFVQYAATVGDIRIVAADTRHAERALGDMCAPRLEQLAGLLVDTGAHPTVVVLHHPPVAVPVLTNPVQYADPMAAHRLAGLIAMCPHVIGVLAGHTHRSDCLNLGSTHLVTMPSLAPDLRKNPEPTALPGRPIVMLHDVLPGGLASRMVVVPETAD